VEGQAFELINRAMRHTTAVRRSCRPVFPQERAAIVDGGAGPQVAALLGVFRRAPTAADQAASEALVAHPPRNPFFAEVPRDAIRVVTAADGSQVTLVAATKLRAVGLDPATHARCDAATRHELVRISLRARPIVRRTALREFDELSRRQRAAAPAPATEGLEVRMGHGSGGGPFEPAQFLAQPVRFGTGRSAGPPAVSKRRGSRSVGSNHLILVLPDGVARVTMVLPRYSSRGPHRAPVDHRRVLRRSARVVDNVASLRIAGRGIEDMFGATTLEYGPDGALVRTARPPK
jgi:hypothetical protein